MIRVSNTESVPRGDAKITVPELKAIAASNDHSKLVAVGEFEGGRYIILSDDYGKSWRVACEYPFSERCYAYCDGNRSQIIITIDHRYYESINGSKFILKVVNSSIAFTRISKTTDYAVLILENGNILSRFQKDEEWTVAVNFSDLPYEPKSLSTSIDCKYQSVVYKNTESGNNVLFSTLDFWRGENLSRAFPSDASEVCFNWISGNGDVQILSFLGLLYISYDFGSTYEFSFDLYDGVITRGPIALFNGDFLYEVTDDDENKKWEILKSSNAKYRVINNVLNLTSKYWHINFKENISVLSIHSFTTDVIVNNSFEEDIIEGNSLIQIPTGWTGDERQPGDIFIKRNDEERDSGFGDNYVVLCGRGTALSQTPILGLVAEEIYKLKFHLSGIESDTQKMGSVQIDTRTAVSGVIQPLSSSSFSEHEITFQARSQNYILIGQATSDDEKRSCVCVDNLTLEIVDEPTLQLTIDDIGTDSEGGFIRASLLTNSDGPCDVTLMNGDTIVDVENLSVGNNTLLSFTFSGLESGIPYHLVAHFFAVLFPDFGMVEAVSQEIVIQSPEILGVEDVIITGQKSINLTAVVDFEIKLSAYGFCDIEVRRIDGSILNNFPNVECTPTASLQTLDAIVSTTYDIVVTKTRDLENEFVSNYDERITTIDSIDITTLTSEAIDTKAVISLEANRPCTVSYELSLASTNNHDHSLSLIDLRNATTYQDSEGDKQTPVNSLEYVDSSTGRPWEECGHYTDEWWGVDLGSFLHVQYIRLQNRSDCCEERLHNVQIYLGEVPNTYEGNALVKENVLVEADKMLQVNIDADGRYLYIRRPLPHSGHSGLTICKIYVFGEFEVGDDLLDQPITGSIKCDTSATLTFNELFPSTVYNFKVTSIFGLEQDDSFNVSPINYEFITIPPNESDEIKKSKYPIVVHVSHEHELLQKTKYKDRNYISIQSIAVKDYTLNEELYLTASGLPVTNKESIFNEDIEMGLTQIVAKTDRSGNYVNQGGNDYSLFYSQEFIGDITFRLQNRFGEDIMELLKKEPEVELEFNFEM